MFEPGVEGRSKLGSEPFEIEVGELVLVGGGGLDASDEGGDVDLGLALGEALGPGRLDAQGIDAAGGKFTGQIWTDVGGEELGVLDLLDDGERVGLGSCPCGVVALEAEEDEETQQAENPVARTPKMPAARSLSAK